jgi:RimJ/RimL family protein N-acetyltransferase
MTGLCFPDPPLTDGVIALRAWKLDDLGFVVSVFEDREVSRYSPTIPFPYTSADALGWLETHEPARLAGTALRFAVIDAATAQPLGALGLNSVSELLKSASVGFSLAPEARGHGYVTRAVRVLARWAFDDLGLARLELTTDPESFSAQRVAERCGFRKEGHLRLMCLCATAGSAATRSCMGYSPASWFRSRASSCPRGHHAGAPVPPRRQPDR